MQECYLYFIQQGESGPVKIGITGNVESRKSSLQSASPHPLNTLLVIPHKNRHLAEKSEQFIHYLFSQLNMSGEWFIPAPHLIEKIEYVKNFSHGEMVERFQTNYFQVWNQISDPINAIHEAIATLHQQINKIVDVKDQYEIHGDTRTAEAILFELKDTMLDINRGGWIKWFNCQMQRDENRRAITKNKKPCPIEFINLDDAGA